MPLILDEPSTELVRRWFEEDPWTVTWWWSRVEVVSSIERRLRQGIFRPSDRCNAIERLEALGSRWLEVTEMDPVRARALSLIARHPLRAADAGQLAAAVLVREHRPGVSGFVSLDRRLAEAARREGFLVPSESG